MHNDKAQLKNAVLLLSKAKVVLKGNSFSSTLNSKVLDASSSTPKKLTVLRASVNSLWEYQWLRNIY